MAIPALGTGNLGYSRDLVAKLMYDTVVQFGKDNPDTTINDVLFIVYPGDAKTIQVITLLFIYTQHKTLRNTANVHDKHMQYGFCITDTAKKTQIFFYLQTGGMLEMVMSMSSLSPLICYS